MLTSTGGFDRTSGNGFIGTGDHSREPGGRIWRVGDGEEGEEGGARKRRVMEP